MGDNPANPIPQLHEMIGEFSNQVTKIKEFDHHFTSYLCLMRLTPQTLSNTIRAFFCLGAQKTHPNQLLDLDPKLPMFTTHHWLLFRRTLRSTRFFLVRRSQIPTTPTRKKRSGLGHHQIQGAKYKILCFQGLFASEIFSSNIWELKEIG